MDLWSLVQVMFRRWWVVVPLLALTAWCTVALTDEIPAEYEVSGAVLLVGPARPEGVIVDEGAQDNRLLQLSGSLGTVSQALGFTLDSERVRSDFADQGLLASYELGTDSRSPIMQFIVGGEDPDLAVATMDALMMFVEDELNRTQDELGTPLEDRIEVRSISADNEPTSGTSSRRRAQVLVLAVGLLATLAAAVSVDALIRLARRRAADRAAARQSEPRDEATDDDSAAPAAVVVEVSDARSARRGDEELVVEPAEQWTLGPVITRIDDEPAADEATDDRAIDVDEDTSALVDAETDDEATDDGERGDDDVTQMAFAPFTPAAGFESRAKA